jgi:peptidoglycan/xylan/chitin deacetylase (PgdA/CDA1 family)
MFKSSYFLVAALAGLLFVPQSVNAAQSIPEDTMSGVILSYSRIGEDSYPESNLRIQQFDAHLQEMAGEEYNVIPLPDLISAIKNQSKLPPRTVAITLDGAYRSSYENAIPKLLAQNLPFTIFYAADHTADNIHQHINIDELKSLSRNALVTLAILPSTYARLSQLETSDVRRLISNAKKFHRDNFGEEAQFFSYPYGEYTAQIADTIKEYNFDAGFGIHSGVVYPGADMSFLPRFSMTENFGDLERFLMVTHALPLPVKDVQPNPPAFNDDTIQIGFSVSPGLKTDLGTLSCFMSGQDHVQTETIGNRVELRSNSDIVDERIRLNCTIPGPSAIGEAPEWRWFGMLMTRVKTSNVPPQENQIVTESFSESP